MDTESTSHENRTLPPAVPVRPRKKRSPLLILAIIAAVLFAGMTFLFVAIMVSAIQGGHSLGGGAAWDQLEVDELQAGSQEETIAIIEITGPITGSGNAFQGQGMVRDVSRQLRAAAQDEDIKAVILQIDSPGGGLTASDILYHEVEALKKSRKKVVVAVGNLAASGGYYIAAPADCIVASPTSLIGSIGVIMSHFDVSELMEKCGVKVNNIKSVERKDILSPFRQMKEDEIRDALRLTRHFHDRFVEVVCQGRSLPEEQVRKSANGMIYSADEAKEQGLIDAIGYFEDALAKAVTLAGIRGKPRLISYRRPRALLDILTQSQSSVQLDMSDLLRAAALQIEARWPGFEGALSRETR